MLEIMTDDAAVLTAHQNVIAEQAPPVETPRQSTAIGIVAIEDSAELDWQRGAVCKGKNPELFFPPKNGSVRMAKTLCGLCGVSVDCLKFANKYQEEGVWGGFTTVERQRDSEEVLIRQIMQSRRRLQQRAAGREY